MRWKRIGWFILGFLFIFFALETLVIVTALNGASATLVYERYDWEEIIENKWLFIIPVAGISLYVTDWVMKNNGHYLDE